MLARHKDNRRSKWKKGRRIRSRDNYIPRYTSGNHELEKNFSNKIQVIKKTFRYITTILSSSGLSLNQKILLINNNNTYTMSSISLLINLSENLHSVIFRQIQLINKNYQ